MVLSRQTNTWLRAIAVPACMWGIGLLALILAGFGIFFAPGRGRIYERE
jgi:hypothetical protein